MKYMYITGSLQSSSLSLSLLAAGHTDLLLEGSLGRSRRLISRCLEEGDEGRVGGGEGVKVLAYSTILGTVMSKVHLSSQTPWGTLLYGVLYM